MRVFTTGVFRILIVILLLSQSVYADPIFPAGKYADLDEMMSRHERQFYNINALPFGLALDAYPVDDAARAIVEQFLEQSASEDFEAVTGSHPYEIINRYDEYGDLGFFGGIALVGTAFKYMTLKREGADEADLTLARERLLRAADSWHIFYQITGGNGLVARGICRHVSDEGEPAYPDPKSEFDIKPLFDENGDPFPEDKDNGTWRDDNSNGVLPEDEWIWVDSCSKDQLVGQAYAMVALYEAMNGDPDIDQSLVERIQEDARGVANMLMEERDITQYDLMIGEGMYDLIIMDADTRPTYHHDLNPYSIEKVYLAKDSEKFNLFNLIMSTGITKALFHITGDVDIEEYHYKELLAVRDFLGKIEHSLDEDTTAFDYIYMGNKTNFDDPDMTAVALWLAIYLEKDPEILNVLHGFLENGWWNRTDEIHTAKLCKQPLWHSIYMTLTNTGVTEELADENAALLSAFSLGPYWNTYVENCDAAEIEAGQCTAIDGTTILTITNCENAAQGNCMASEALDPSIRPPSNFNARSNPFNVNGGGGNCLNPGGDLMAAYWMARYMTANAAGTSNVSPNARDHMPVGGWPDNPDGDAEDEIDGDAENLIDGDETPADEDNAVDGDEISSDGDLPDSDGDESTADGDSNTDDSKDGGGCNSSSMPSFGILFVLLTALAFRRRNIYS